MRRGRRMRLKVLSFVLVGPVGLHQDRDVVEATPFAQHVRDAPLAATLRLLEMQHQYDCKPREFPRNSPMPAYTSWIPCPGIDLRGARRSVDDHEDHASLTHPLCDPCPPLAHGQ